MDVVVDAVDRPQPIVMRAAVVGSAAGLPIVEYLHADATSWQSAPTVLGFSGGGMSGAMLALLAEHLAALGIRLIAFDMPGHTPDGLLGADTPPRALISRASAAMRHAVSVAMMQRWRPRATTLQVLSHSAGIVDVARLIGRYGDSIDRFVITGAPMPGLGSMAQARKAAREADSLGGIRLSTVIRTRCVPAGSATLIYGPPAGRAISDAQLARYECLEHVGVPLSLLWARSVLRQDWRGRRVLLIGSAGDAIAPPNRIKRASEQLHERGAEVACTILPKDLPHAFLTFTDGAAPVAQLIASW